MKNSIKKTLSVIIFLSVLINSFCVGAFASDSVPVTDVSEAVSTITVVLDKDKISKDEILTVSITIDANYYVTGIQLPVLYDKNQFEVVTGSGVGGYLDFNEDSLFSNGSYALNGNTTHSNGFKNTSNPEKWNTDEARAQYKYAWITASANTSATDFRLVLPENDKFVSFKLKALEDVEDTTESVFISTEWAKTTSLKSGIFTLGFSESETNKNPLSYVSVGMTYVTETKVFFPAEKIELDKTYVTLTKENPTVQLTATITPENATDKTVIWTTDDDTVATVDENGLVTRVGEGGVTITATDSAGNTAVCEIYIPHQCEKSTMIYYEENPATCYDSGEIAYYECYCGSYYSDENAENEIFYSDIYVKPLAHPQEYLEKTEKIDATHISDGNIEYWTCALCGDSFSDEECTKKVTDVVIPMTGHQDASSVEWTSDESDHKKICSCGEILQSEEHSFVWITDNEATCTSPGFRHEECTVCGYTRNENTVITVPHEAVKYDASAPDCTENGNTLYYRCVNCEKCFTDEACENEISLEDTVISATGHTYLYWVIDKNPDCTNDGKKHKTCQVCGYTVSEKIDKNGHSLTVFERIEATCTDKGNIQYFYCSSCETYFADSKCIVAVTLDDVVILAKGHIYSDWITDAVADCENDGQRHKTCEVCNDTITEVLPKSGHNYLKEVTPATPESEGFTTNTCLNCGDTFKSDFEDILGLFAFGGTVKSTGEESEEITVTLTSKGGYQVEYTQTLYGTSAEFSFDSVAEGEYVLKISKKNHAIRTYNLVIDKDGITTDAVLHLKGDIDGNGRITVSDYSQALRHVKKTAFLEDYEISCADVDEDGRITIIDYSSMIRHVKKIAFIW